MKTNSWLKTLALSFALLPAATGFSATFQEPAGLEQGGPGGKHGRGKGHAANPEMRAYVQQNVMPVVRQQRQKLEGQLSTADKTQLTAYRSQLRQLQQKQKALRQSFRTANTNVQAQGQRPQLTEAQKQQMQQLHTERRAVMQNVATLAQKYSTNISQLAAEVQPQRDKWAADMKAIRMKNATPEQQQRMQQHQAGKDGKTGKISRHNAQHKYFAPARFLLMNPNAPAKQERAKASSRAALYPNPASATQRLNYEVKREGNVKVEVLDERGKALRTVLEQKQDKGQQSLEVNISDLPRGTYFYKISSKGNTETRRFVKE